MARIASEFEFDLSIIKVGCFYTYKNYLIKVLDKDSASVDINIVDSNNHVEKFVGTMEQLKSKLSPSEEVVRHKQFAKIMRTIQKGFAPYLAGPAGTGKSELCKQIAEALGKDFYFANSIQERYELVGYGDAVGKLVDTEFYKAFTQGGLFFLDEIDNSDASALITLNAALANKYITFPVVGRVDAHPDFCAIAAGNTCGRGGDSMYTERKQLDAASLNRFELIRVGYDERIEIKIAKGNQMLVDFVHDLRRASKRIDYPVTVSYRNIKAVTELENEFPLHEVIDMSVTKGAEADEVNMLYEALDDKRNKYAKAMKHLAVSMEVAY